ncbi:MAG: extensin family protein [Pseudomonadota bacterium]
MGRKRRVRRRTVRKRRTDQRLLRVAAVFVVIFGAIAWLQTHPGDNPWAPLDLNDPVGLATASKLVALRTDIPECRAVLVRSNVPFETFPATGEGPCARPDRTQLSDFPLTPSSPAVTCPVAAALEMWRQQSVEPAARRHFGADLVRIEHMGVYNCRRIRGTNSAAWSQHATGNAIDISAFVLSNGDRITVLEGWNGDEPAAKFLREVRDGACGVYATVLSPDFNAAHADHFHFDQSERWAGVCR